MLSLKYFFFLIFAPLSQQSCSCNLYGTQEGCLLQPNACIWNQDQQSCSDNTTMPDLCPINATKCGPPYCYKSGAYCQYVFNIQRDQFANCQQVQLNNTQSLEAQCSDYNCQVQGSGCASISNCSAFTNEKYCLGRFYPNSQGQKITCEWDSTTNTCFDFTDCESLNVASYCFSGPDCYFESATGCHQLQCSQYASCTPAECYFNGVQCTNKVCSQMNNQSSCDGSQSYQAGICAWKSGTCKSCWSFIIGISMLIYSLYV